MSYYYPQTVLTLRVRFEDFGKVKDKPSQIVHSFSVLAKRVQVNINSYTEADTFTAEIDFKNFPFDPRCIRSAGVTIHMEDMGRLKRDDGSYEQVKPTRANAVFIGFADEESISLDNSTRTVRLQGRDLTSIFLDRKYPHGTLPVEQSLQDVLQNILDHLPENKNADPADKIKLDNRVGATPTLASYWRDKEEGSGKKNVKRDQSYWDVIQDVVHKAGLIAYMELDKLVLSKPRVLFSKQQAKIFVYGRNISDLEYKRQIGRMKKFNLVVRCLNVEEKGSAVMAVQIPGEATEAWSNETGIPNKVVVDMPATWTGAPADKKDEEGKEAEPKPAPYISLSVTNVKNREHLIEIGQNLYEEIGRQQIEGNFTTFDMETTEGRTKDTFKCFDVLKLRVGTPILVDIDQGDMHGFSRLNSVSQRKEFLVGKWWDPKVAELFAQNYGKFTTPFYTNTVEFSVDESGFKCRIGFINFIEIEKQAQEQVTLAPVTSYSTRAHGRAVE